jgi:hypothetical protein
MNLRIPAMLGLAATLAFGTLPAQDQEELKLSNKWRIEVSEGANTAGTILFRITPDKGTAIEVPVPIREGRSENDVAKDIVATFKATLDPKTFHVERDDGEDVLVKKRKGPNFEVKFVESSVKGTRINVAKE